MEGRFIVIGDVHGCALELEDLLALVRPAPDDHVIFLGDLVNRGPESHRVLEIARHLRAVSLLGNHEHRLLQWKTFGDDGLLKDYDHDTIEHLNDEDWNYLRHLRLTYELPQFETVCVHAGFLPRLPWAQQTWSVVTDIQVVDAAGQSHRRGECPEGRPWADLWQGPPFVLYGHTPRRDPYEREWSIGLDTGCVFGGHLTACVLPGRRLHQVRARRAYVYKRLQ